MLDKKSLEPLLRALRVYINPYFSKYIKDNLMNQNYIQKMTNISAVNSFVAEATNNEIKNILTEEFKVLPPTASEATVACFVVSEYIKIKWKTAFDKELTKTESFTPLNITKTTLEVPIMNNNNIYLPYHVCPNKNFTLAKFESEGTTGGGYDLVLGLPANNTETSLNDMINTFVEHRSHYVQSLHPRRVSLKLPRVKLDSDIVDLIPVAKKMCNGQMKGIFEKNGMKNLCKNSLFEEYPDANLFVSEYVSRCTLKIDEEGMIAAGAAAMIASYKSVGASAPPPKFHCNRPFMTSIMRGDEIFFIAIITGENIEIFK